MLGLKSFRTAAVVIRGIELAEEDKEGSVQNGEAWRSDCNDAGDLASCVGCLTNSHSD
jgi:hypothetical protein